MSNKTERAFACACKPDETMKLDQLMDHLITAHGIENGKGDRRMTMHLDGREYYSTTYEWTFNGNVIVTETCTSVRDKYDPFWGLDCDEE